MLKDNMFCIPKYLTEKLLQEIDKMSPEDLIKMTSKQRNKFLSDIIGEENAKNANALIEKKLLLKNQTEGLYKAIKEIAGKNKKIERDMLAKVERMETLLTPENEDAFYEDLASKKLGVDITLEEAGNIASLAKIASEKKTAMEKGKRRADDKDNAPATEEEMAYGRAAIAFDNYMAVTKALAAKETIAEKAKEYLSNPVNLLSDIFTGTFNTAKSLKTTFDNSYAGNQGRNNFLRGIGESLIGKPRTLGDWFSMFAKSHEIMYKSFTGKPVLDEMRAYMISDPKWEQIKRSKTALNIVEEDLPNDWYTRLPYLGRPFKAVNDAFLGASYWARYLTARQMIRIAEQSGSDLTQKDNIESIGKLVNNLTARGGRLGNESPGVVNMLLFSIRKMKAELNIMTMHLFDRKASGFVKKKAAKNLLAIIVGQSLILGIAKLIDDDSVELDPRSPDFGKIRKGNTRFDISPQAPFIRLAVRLLPLLGYNLKAYYKTSGGDLKELNIGKYGARTGVDILYEFMENKSSPAASVILAHLKGTYPFSDKPVSPVGDIKQLYSPLAAENIYDQFTNDEDSANKILAIILSAYGVNTNTYEDTKKKKGKTYK
jgi:hypothetical protein